MQNNKIVLRKISAYSVHVFTSLGAVLGIAAILLTFRGYFQYAIWALFVAVIVDSVDGTLARAAQTKKYAAAIDGALMDNIIDFVTWTIAPLIWLYAVTTIPAWPLLICVAASIFGFTQVEAKTSDHYFTGFPSFWNIVCFYLYLMHLSTNQSVIILLIFAVATIIPIRFVYPSQTPHFRKLTLVLGCIYVLQFMAMVFLYKNTPPLLIYSSFIFPVYYFLLSFYLHLKHLRI